MLYPTQFQVPRFQYHNGQAWLEVKNDRYEHCQNKPQRATWEHARLNGADFRTTGNTPYLPLEIVLDGDLQLINGADSASSKTHEVTAHISIDDKKSRDCGGVSH